MSKIALLFFIFLKIGAFSFGGGYAMLPFIQQEFINHYHFITNREFLDLLAISQSTPGPIAINSATFVGFKTAGVPGSIASSLGVMIFSLVGLTILSSFLDKFKDNKRVENLLVVLRPLTMGFILASAISSAVEIQWGAYEIIAFVAALALLKSKKIGSISVVFLFGLIGIRMAFI